MILAKKLTVSAAEHVQLPSAGAGAVRPEIGKSDTKGGNETAAKRSRRRDDPARFLSAAQVSVLAAATPWPYSVFVQIDAWTGLRPGGDDRVARG